jgi:hypothetical protein
MNYLFPVFRYRLTGSSKLLVINIGVSTNFKAYYGKIHFHLSSSSKESKHFLFRFFSAL